MLRASLSLPCEYETARHENANVVLLFVRSEIMQSVHHFVLDRASFCARQGWQQQSVVDSKGEQVESHVSVAGGQSCLEKARLRLCRSHGNQRCGACP
jgi:hypothetical protein